MNNSPISHAIGALKLANVHVEHPTALSGPTLLATSNEAIQRLNAAYPHREELGRLYAELVRVTPPGHLPYVSLEAVDHAPYLALITNANGEVVHRQRGKTIDGLVQLIATRFEPPQGPGMTTPTKQPASTTLEQLRQRYSANYITAETLLADHLPHISSVQHLRRKIRERKLQLQLWQLDPSSKRSPWVIYLPQLAKWLDQQAEHAANAA